MTPNKPLFLGRPNVGLFVVTHVEPMQGQKTVAPGAIMTGSRVTLATRGLLPPGELRSFTLTGRKAQGAQAGELGLEDWLPTTIGTECVLAFEPSRMTDAGDAVFLGAGATASSAWNDCETYVRCITPVRMLDPARVASAIRQSPTPHELFFRLVFDYDRTVWNSPLVCFAGGEWLVDFKISPLERRTVVAHFISSPATLDHAALAALAAGMLSVAGELDRAGQTSSAGVVFERLYGFFSDPKSGIWRISPPPSSDVGHLLRIVQLPQTGVSAAVRDSVSKWLSPPAR